MEEIDLSVYTEIAASLGYAHHLLWINISCMLLDLALASTGGDEDDEDDDAANDTPRVLMLLRLTNVFGGMARRYEHWTSNKYRDEEEGE